GIDPATGGKRYRKTARMQGAHALPYSLRVAILGAKNPVCGVADARRQSEISRVVRILDRPEIEHAGPIRYRHTEFAGKRRGVATRCDRAGTTRHWVTCNATARALCFGLGRGEASDPRRRKEGILAVGVRNLGMPLGRLSCTAGLR